MLTVEMLKQNSKLSGLSDEQFTAMLLCRKMMKILS